MPALIYPGFLTASEVGHVHILHARQVPGQPGDRVGLVGRSIGKLLSRQSIEGPTQNSLDPTQRLDHDVLRIHSSHSSIATLRHAARLAIYRRFESVGDE